ncbi:Uncharacterized membrane protein [Parasphingorhabdus marina DSM 22363]|uniref:Uncharacterized membrane protein n=1 Tax=Parasphingorhabdus marina DSM 22363 TaxID=1123272 RepID=A0A1N6DB49_9SPHN|nr:DUF2339 domain-containing protein [Parasphingorhabdus marina]SIN68025.1 Uncharacterized membrane protein [Parasphingorhabdus marina DSM 22363]
MELLLIGGLLALIILVIDTRQKLAALKDEIIRMKSETLDRPRADSAPPPEPKPEPEVQPRPTEKPRPVAVPKVAKPAPTARKAAEPLPDIVRESPPPPEEIEPEPRPSAAKRFEELIGGKLPIWIGGIALIFAGFFLVRFSIEAGLFGPTARCITATLFGILLISLSEFGYRIPRFGQIFRDDARIGHSLAGAGIAVLYATLYMASELYGLLGLTGALAGVVVITILAFALSQKHGPPTAIMGLIGGFAAPYVAGLGAESVAPLLIYLAVFTAGLFGLAIYRGWAWLALLATGGSVIWTTLLLFLEVSSTAPFIGAFIVLLAIGGVLTLARTGTSFAIARPVMQSVPLVVGLLQLILLAPLIEFSLLSWAFFGVLSVFSIALAWKDHSLTPAVAGALGLSLTMTAISFWSDGAGQMTLTASAGLIALFMVAGHLFHARQQDGWIWAVIGVLAPAAWAMVAAAAGNLDWSENIWALLCALVAANAALLSWRVRIHETGLPQPLASGIAALFLAFALWLWLPEDAAVLVAVAVAGGLIAWAGFVNRRSVKIEAGLFMGFGGLLMAVFGAPLIETLMQSLAGETDLYSLLPATGDIALQVFAPGVVMTALAWFYRDVWGRRGSQILATIGLTACGGFLYHLAKQPLAIGPIQAFAQYGFAERLVFTHLLALAGWLLLRQPWPDHLARPLHMLGAVLGTLALFRFLWFDIFLLSPMAEIQYLGTAPVANLGSLHYAAMAIWLWVFARTPAVRDALPNLPRALEITSLVAAMAAVMVTVRQAVHGSDIASPAFTSTETYLYSAALLILAIAWLARGIQTTNVVLRIAGLLLMTVVTFKVFLFDAAQLDGLLRILSFLGLGIALIGIGWIYGKVMKSGEPDPEKT